MFFGILDFFNKKHDFLKIVFSLKQYHYFWKVGVDFGRPRDRPKSKKVCSGPSKKRYLEKTRKSRLFTKSLKRETLHFDHMYGACFMFLKNAKVKTQKIMKKQVVQKHEKIRFGAVFGRPKVLQNGDFFETWKTIKKHGRRSISETWGCPKLD